jgi:hypothetical protein
MQSCTKRPEVAVIDGHVWVFVGGYHQRMDVASAKVLRDKLSAALKQLKLLPEPTE